MQWTRTNCCTSHCMAQECVGARHVMYMVIHVMRLSVVRSLALCSSPCSFPCVSPILSSSSTWTLSWTSSSMWPSSGQYPTGTPPTEESGPLAENAPLTKFGQHLFLFSRSGWEEGGGRVLGPRRSGSGSVRGGGRFGWRRSGWGPEGWGPGRRERRGGGGPKGGAPKGGSPQGEARRVAGPKFRAFFPSPATSVFLSSLSWESPNASRQGFTGQPESLNVQIRGPLAFKKHHQNSTRKHRREGRKSEKLWWEREKEHFGRSWRGRSVGGRCGRGRSKLAGPRRSASISMDKLAQEDHSYRLSHEEFQRYQNRWYLTLNE